MDAVYRLAGLVYFVLIGWIVLAVAGAAGLLWMFFDVITALLINQSIQGEYRAVDFLRRVFDWGMAQINFVLFGEGDFPILP